MNSYFLNKLKAPLIMGAMLIGAVACSDNDDEISSLNNRVDELEKTYVTISSMEDQIADVKALIPDLTSLTNRVKALEDAGYITSSALAGYATSEDLTKALDALDYLTESDVTEDFLTNILDGVYAAQSALDSVESDIDDLEVAAGVPDPSLVADVAKLKTDVENLKSDVANCVGNDALATYLGDGWEKRSFSADAEAAAKKYFDSIKSTLYTATEGADLSSEVVLNTTSIKALDTALSTLKDHVTLLEGRIQSLVFVPESATGDDVVFVAQNYITLPKADSKTGETVKLFLTPKNANTAKMTFCVRPASYASVFESKFKAGESVISLFSEKYTRAGELFTIKDVKAGDNGKFTVEIEKAAATTSDLGFGVAIKVDMTKVQNDATSEVDFLSDYVNVSAKEGANITNMFVYGDAMTSTIAGNQKVYATTDSSLTEGAEWKNIPYTSTNEFTFFNDAKLYVKVGNGYKEFSELYSDDILVIDTPAQNATVSAVSGYTAAANKFTLGKTSFSIKDNTPAVIGNKVTSKAYTFAITDGTNKLVFGTSTSNVLIYGATAVYGATEFEAAWKYGSYPYLSPALETAESLEVTTDTNGKPMPVELYNGLDDMAYTSSTTGATVKIMKVAEDGTRTDLDPAYQWARASVYLYSIVAVASDKQPIQVYLHNMPTETADYVVIYTYAQNPDGTEAVASSAYANKTVIEIPVHIDGIPAINGGDVISIENNIDADSYDMVLRNVSQYLWDNNKATLKATGITEAQFLTLGISSVSKDPVDNTNGVALNLVNNYDVIANYNFSSINYGKEYTNLSITLNVACYGKVTIKANVTLNNDYELKANTAYVHEGNRVEIETTYDDTTTPPTFTVVDYKLQEIYAAKGANVVYTIADQAGYVAGATGMPSISNNTLAWGNWSKEELKMVATAYVGATPVATQEFTAFIVNPFAGQDFKVTNLDLYINDYNTANASVNLFDALKLKAVVGATTIDNVFADNSYAAFGSVVFAENGTSYGGSSQLVDLNGSTVAFTTAAANQAVLTGDVTYNYKVTYSLSKFSTEFEKDIVVTIHKNGTAN